ncbi:hypothetical protein I552_4827 [Mycobacterium xenopi 3993]|nr:hypothetical protein I552_4827 [Mycobacterium xenopi 3993]
MVDAGGAACWCFSMRSARPSPAWRRLVRCMRRHRGCYQPRPPRNPSAAVRGHVFAGWLRRRRS